MRYHSAYESFICDSGASSDSVWSLASDVLATNYLVSLRSRLVPSCKIRDGSSLGLLCLGFGAKLLNRGDKSGLDSIFLMDSSIKSLVSELTSSSPEAETPPSWLLSRTSASDLALAGCSEV